MKRRLQALAGRTLRPTVRQLVSVPSPDSMVVLGDSLAYGVASTDNAAGFVDLLRKRLPGAAWNVVATPGATSQWILDHTDGRLPDGADLVIVELGTNDAADFRSAAFRRKYTWLLAKARDHYPTAVLLCLGAWRSTASPLRLQADRTMRSVATEFGSHFLPLADLYDDPQNHDAQEVHPNDAGHRAILERVCIALGVPTG